MNFKLTEEDEKKMRTDVQLQSLVVRRIKKELNKVQDKRMRLAAAQFMIFSEVKYYLDALQKEAPWRVESAKESLKLRLQVHLAEVLSLIDTYPNIEPFDDFTTKALHEYVNWAEKKGNAFRI